MAGETCCEMISNALMRCPLCFAGEVSHQEQVGDFGQLDEGETFAYQKLLPAPNLNLFSFILLDPSSRLGIPLEDELEPLSSGETPAESELELAFRHLDGSDSKEEMLWSNLQLATSLLDPLQIYGWWHLLWAICEGFGNLKEEWKEMAIISSEPCHSGYLVLRTIIFK